MDGGNEASGVGGEDLHPAGGEGDGGEEEHGDDGDPAVADLAHFNEDHGAEAEGDDGEELVGNAEDRPQALGDAGGVERTLIQEVAPGADEQAGGEDVAEPRVRPAEARGNISQQI